MLDELTNDLKQIALAGVGAAVILAETSSAFMNECLKRGSQAVEQGRAAAEEFAARAGRSYQEYQEQWMDKRLSKLTPEERSALRRRLDELDELDSLDEPDDLDEPDNLDIDPDKTEEKTSPEE